MIFVKYVLSKTGLFPQWEPQVSDILEVALNSHVVKRVHTPRGVKYFYIIPAMPNSATTSSIVRKCRANGVILHSHYSKHYDTRVFRVRDRNQQFLRDVAEVNHNAATFQEIMNKRLQERATKKYVLRELFGKYGK